MFRNYMNRRSMLKHTAGIAGAAAMTPLMGLRAKELPSLSDFIRESENRFNYRNRMPRLIERDFIGSINFADYKQNPNNVGVWKYTDGSGMASVPEQYKGKQIAIIGAGAAGLALGHELMKLGVQPVYFEIQSDSGNPSYARPMGRGYSWNFELTTQPGGYGWYPSGPIAGPGPVGGVNVGKLRSFADMGAMRFPDTHTSLHTYVDTVFKGDYYYGRDLNLFPAKFAGGLQPQWPEWRDPGDFVGGSTDIYGQPSDNDTAVYPTVFYTNGMPKSSSKDYVRLDTGTTLGQIKGGDLGAVYNLVYSNWGFLYGPDPETSDPKQGPGLLRYLVTQYNTFTQDPTTANADLIMQEWKDLNSRFEGMTLYDGLRLAGSNVDWTKLPAYDNWNDNPEKPSLIEMFGEIGIGSGGFDVFFWTTLIETLRIRIHLDEQEQRAFVGGTSYMLSPFLTHNTPTALKSMTNLYNESLGYIITDPVSKITKAPNGGVTVTTRDASSYQENSVTFGAVFLTASPSAIRSRILISPDLIDANQSKALKRIRLTNSGKIAVNFPNTPSDPYSSAFWMHRDASNPWDPKNDDIVTTLTDENVRSIYTFDDFNWGTYNAVVNSNAFQAGCLMISYSWDFDSDAFTPLSLDDQAWAAWDQLKRIYADNDRKLVIDDNCLGAALARNDVATIVWSREDDFAGAFRMADPGRNLHNMSGGNTFSEWDGLNQAIIGRKTDGSSTGGLFVIGEAVAELGLSGWIEGAIQTALMSTDGFLQWLNTESPTFPTSNPISQNSNKFSLPYLPGNIQYIPSSE